MNRSGFTKLSIRTYFLFHNILIPFAGQFSAHSTTTFTSQEMKELKGRSDEIGDLTLKIYVRLKVGAGWRAQKIFLEQGWATRVFLRKLEFGDGKSYA